MTDNRTTELRVKLDTLGIEHTDANYKRHMPITAWTVDDATFCYVESSESTDLHIDNATPEQAVAAMLRSESVDYMLNTIGKLEEENERLRSSCGTLIAEQVEKATYAHSIHADCADADWQAIANELNAELGSGTCNPVETEVITYYDEYGHVAVKVHVMECDECGGTYEHINGDYERCPRCGKAVRA